MTAELWNRFQTEFGYLSRVQGRGLPGCCGCGVEVAGADFDIAASFFTL